MVIINNLILYKVPLLMTIFKLLFLFYLGLIISENVSLKVQNITTNMTNFILSV